jgi:hypothetical protein
MNTELSVENKMQAIGSLVILVLRYSFGIINWHREETRHLDRKTRKILTVCGQHHLRADTDRLYVPRKGGLGLTQMEAAYITGTTKLVEYIERSEDPLLQVVRTYQPNANASLWRAAHKCEKNANEKWGEKKGYTDSYRTV